MKTLLIICLSFILCLHVTNAQVGSLYFKEITTDQGLPSNWVNCITRDTMGFIWFGTSEGLVRYDGIECKVFKHDPKDPSSITWNGVSSLLVDRRGNLWIGTGRRGLNRFNYKLENFISYRYDETDTTSLSSENGIRALYEDKQGQFWVGSMYGINRYKAEKDCFTRYTHDEDDSESISADPINCIFEDSRNNFWVGTQGGGLDLFDRETGKAVHFRNDPDDPSSISNNYIHSVFEDADGKLWISTERGYNWLIYDTSGITFFRPIQKEGIPIDISERKVYDMFYRKGSNKLVDAWVYETFIDNLGNIWIGTRYEGVKYYTSQYPFHSYRYQSGDPEGLHDRSVNAICEDPEGDLWIGTAMGGLYLYDRDYNCFRREEFESKRSICRFATVMTLLLDSNYDLWIGTWGCGIYRFERKSGRIFHYMPDKENPLSLNSPIIYCLTEDSRKNIWIGTNGGGVNLYDRKTDSFTQFPDLSRTDSFSQYFKLSKLINKIYEDYDENLWFGSGSGLFLYDRENQAIKTWKYNPDDSTTLGGFNVLIIFEDSKKSLWIGTEYGLNRYNRNDDTFTRYGTGDGLPGRSISDIFEDDHGNLWITTDKGISRFDPDKNTFTNYDINDGLHGNVFNQNAGCKLSTGEFIFGGLDGFTLFHPDSIKDILSVPRVIITDFQIFNKSVIPGSDKSPLQKSICMTNEIILPYYQHSISFEFAVLDYVNPNKNRYKYKLDGLQEEWIETGADHRTATYTNLYPGKYTFRVIGSNSKGIWNEEGITLHIVITPPVWRTKVAYILYLLLIGGIIWLIWKTQLRRIHIRHELKMKEFETAQLQQLDQMKSRFFANISHEIRTPLTLILGPLDQMISEIPGKKWKDLLRIMARNGRNLLRLINQLLDFSKLESGRMSLKAKKMNIVPLIKGMTYSFDSLAKRKGIALTFQSDEDIIPVYFDQDKLEKIMANLLSNAFKFTPKGGVVSVRLSIVKPEKRMVEIGVTDTGIGIAPEHIDHIFERYYQANIKNEQPGTGIGLSLTKELVELHHGTITIQSTPGGGSTFLILLPMGKEHLANEEIGQDQPAEMSEKVLVQEELEPTAEEVIQPGEETSNKSGTKSGKDAPYLLIVEDTEDVRSYIKGFLEKHFQILEAEDGQQGYEKAVEKIPDLIISDVMMPGMNGFKLCKKLKTDERTSHIPVILLTARASESDKMQGLETGADDYIVKPFNAKELTVRAKNLIDQRRKLRERFTQDIMLSPKEISVTSADERFLKRAMEVIENNMGNADFGVESFSREIGLSHSQLHRKVRALTNQSPVEFIRSLRLKRAHSLLEQSWGNVAEISFEVGFNNPSYFAECFRKQFGKSPSEYTRTK